MAIICLMIIGIMAAGFLAGGVAFLIACSKEIIDYIKDEKNKSKEKA